MISEFEYLSSKGQMFEGHHHNIIEMYYLLSGQRYYFIGGKAHLVMPGDLVIIRENVEHKVFAAGIGSYKRYILNTDREFVHTHLSDITANCLTSFIDSNIFVLRPKDTSFIELLFHKMQNLNLDIPDTKEKKEFLAAYSINILEEVEKAIASFEANDDYQELSYVNKNILEIAEYINTHHANTITLDILSEKFNLSKFYLCKLFKKSIGMTFSEFLNSIRITEAKNLLENTEMSIGQVASKVGYNDIGYFCRVFKNTMQITALKYRKQTKRDM